ncbi:MAG: Hemolysin activation/secretion protein, partial [Rhodoferax sp.]|nr:Hemolysin activation/secretion protein [Rhodoferax sp.]
EPGVLVSRLGLPTRKFGLARPWLLAGLVAGLMTGLAGAALAQAVVAPALPTQPGAPPEVPRPAYLPPASAQPFQLPAVPVPTAPAADSRKPLTLQRVVFNGNTVIPTAELEALAQPYLGRGASLNEVEVLRLQLTQLFVARGFVNSGVLLRRAGPDDGMLEFDVVEGRLSAIALHGMERLQDAYVTEALSRPGDGPLNLDVLRERFQLLLSDPLFDRLNARLLPGAQPGEAVLDIDVARATPYQLTVFANNYRPVSLGAGAMGVSGWVRNLSGRGDLLEGSLQGPVDGGGDLRASLAWRVPLNYRGTQLTLALDHGNSSVVDESVRALDIRSRLTSAEVGVAQTLYETLTRKVSIGVTAAHRENRTWLLGEPFSFTQGEPDGVTRERLARFWQEFAQRSETQVLALRSTFSWGRNNLQNGPALQDATGLPAADGFPTHYRVWLGQAQFARQVARNGAQWIVRGSVQRSPDRLLALDSMAIGGVNTVRGYRENQLVRDQGAVLTLEFEWPLVRDAEHGLRVVAVPFYDLGRGRNHGEAATTLRSAGLTTRATWQGLSIDLTLAKRIDPPALARGLGSNLQDKGVHLQVAYRF